EQLRPRWKRAVSLVNGSLGEDVGRLYVAQHYTESHRVDMDQLVDALQQAYHSSIAPLPWMSEETRFRALEKLAKFNPMVGSPGTWPASPEVSVAATDHTSTREPIAVLGFAVSMSECEKQPAPKGCHMSPLSVNVSSSPLVCAIVFPSAILQPPFISPEAS